MEDKERSGQQSSPSLEDLLCAATQLPGDKAALVNNSTRVLDIPVEDHFESLRITDSRSSKGVRVVPPAVEAQLQGVELAQSTNLKQGWDAPLAKENDERCGVWTSHSRNDMRLSEPSLSPLGVRQSQVSESSSTRELQGSNSLVTKSDRVSDGKPVDSSVPGTGARRDLECDMLCNPSTIGSQRAEQPLQPTLHEHRVGEQDPEREGSGQFQETIDDNVARSLITSFHDYGQHDGRVSVPTPGERAYPDVEVQSLQHGHDEGDGLASGDALLAGRHHSGSRSLISPPPRTPNHKHLIDSGVGVVKVKQSPPGHTKNTWSQGRSGVKATAAEEPARDRGRKQASLHHSNHQQPRIGRSTSITDYLNDALSILLRADNQERFRRERAKVPGSHGMSGVSPTAQQGERGGPGMRWTKGGFLPPSKHGKPPLATGRRQGKGYLSSGESGQGVRDGGGEGESHGMGEASQERLVREDARKAERSVGSGEGQGEPHITSSMPCNRETGAPQRYSMRGAATAPWERHTKGFGSRILRKMGFDGTTGARETELVTTLATEAMASEETRGRERGGLGYVCPVGRDRGGHCRSAPSDMDFERRRSDPSPAYSGVTVHFPFDAPMKPQGQLMQRVIAALKNKKHALLESPTGTGKSTALLCSTLAWQRAELVRTGKAPQIIYGARTHTQLSQMVGELKKCPYRPTMAILGSRQQLCIHPDVGGAGSGMEEGDEGDEHFVGDFASVSPLDGDGLGMRGVPRGLGIASRPRDSGGDGRASWDGTALSGSNGSRRGAQQKRPSRSRRSMQEMCHALKSKVEDQRKTNQMPVLVRGGGDSAGEEGMPPVSVGPMPYNDKEPNLRVDFAAIDGRLRDTQRQMAGCPFYRAMSMPEYAHLTHELGRPAVGLENGADGIWDLEDLRGFCRDPRGFMYRKRDKQSTVLAGRNKDDVGNGGDPVVEQEVSSSSVGSPKRQASRRDPRSIGHAVKPERLASTPVRPHPQGAPISPEVRGGRCYSKDVSDAGSEVGARGRRCERTRGGADKNCSANTGACCSGSGKAGSGGTLSSIGMLSSTAAIPSQPYTKEVIHLLYDEDDARGNGDGVAGAAHVMSAESPSPGRHGNPVAVTAVDSSSWGSPASLAAGTVIASAMEEGECLGKGSRCGVGGTGGATADQNGASATQALGCPYFTAQALAAQAQLVLVPYNYIMDPQVRKSLTVSLTDNVIVLDEAHNIESVCRDAGSLELPVTALSHLATSLCHLAATEEFHCSALFLLGFVKHLTEFVARESKTLEDLRSGKVFDRPRGTPAEERNLKGKPESVKQRWAFDSAGRNFWSDLVAGQDKFGHHALTAEGMHYSRQQNFHGEEKGELYPVVDTSNGLGGVMAGVKPLVGQLQPGFDGARVEAGVCWKHAVGGDQGESISIRVVIMECDENKP